MAQNLTVDELRQIVLKAVSRLGGVGSISEVKGEIARISRFGHEQCYISGDFDDGFDVQLVTALTQLMQHRQLIPTDTGQWKITEKGGDFLRKHSLNYVLMARLRSVKSNSEPFLTAPGIDNGVADSKAAPEAKDTIMAEVPIPSIGELINPTLRALHNLRGSGENDQIHDEVTRILSLSEEQLNVGYNPRASYKTTILGRLALSRTYLKQYGMIENPTPGFWMLTEAGKRTEVVDVEDVKRVRNDAIRRQKQIDSSKRVEINKPDPPILLNETANTFERDSEHILSIDDLIANYSDWRQQLLDSLRQLDPTQYAAFLRRVLLGGNDGALEILSSRGEFIEGKRASGGIAPTTLWFHSYFGSRQLAVAELENLRRATQMNRADRGLLITLGTVTREAQRQAGNSRLPAIDLMDGETLVQQLQEQHLGIKREIVRVERITVDLDFFANI